MNWIKKIAIALPIALCTTAALSTTNFPTGPVKLVVPFPAGGPTDTVARLLAQKLQDKWGKPVIVEYKPGAGTAIGADFVAKAPPDGHTIGMVNSSLAVNATLRTNLPYDTLKDLAAVTQLYDMQLAIVANPSAPFNNLKELIDYAKKNPTALNYGTPGAGSTTHLGAELLQREAGFTMQHIAMKGSAPAHTELMGGRLQLVVDPFLSVYPYIKAGRMKMIATMGAEKVAGHDFPTVSQIIPNFSVGALQGFVAPSATPKPILEKIQKDIAEALSSEDMEARAKEYGMKKVASTPEQFQDFLKKEIKRWEIIIKEANIAQE